jgi:CheY-like chemotaxis protein
MKTVLVLEDDAGVCESLQRFLGRYGDEITVVVADDPKHALKLLTFGSHSPGPDALILDITMPYGTATKELNGRTDPFGYETGKRVLGLLREWERANGKEPPLWVAVITVRSKPQFLAEVKDLLDGRGLIYTKPFDDFVLENDLTCVLGIKSKVPPGLLPEDYAPPDLNTGGSR